MNGMCKKCNGVIDDSFREEYEDWEFIDGYCHTCSRQISIDETAHESELSSYYNGDRG